MAKKEIGRREFLISGGIAVGALAVVGTGVHYLDTARSDKQLRQDFLRPPGAINEVEFMYGCIKCGLCVQICPVQAIKLAGIHEGLSYGTPYIDVRNQACDFSCDALQCVETCPTAVLNFTPFKEAGLKAVEEATEGIVDLGNSDVNPFEVQKVAMKEAVKMGTARVNEKTCLAVQGKGFKGSPRSENFKGVYRQPYDENAGIIPVKEKTFDREICDLCVTECPIGEKAIILEKNNSSVKPKVLEGCTGCGVCVMVCPTQRPSIVVEPVKS
jgi:ferredoxin-type protein NapG